MQGQKAVGTSCRKGKYSQIQGKNFFPMDMIQHFTRLSQDILEQVGDFRHLRGEGLDPPHLLKASTLWNKGLGKMASRTYFQQKSLWLQQNQNDEWYYYKTGWGFCSTQKPASFCKNTEMLKETMRRNCKYVPNNDSLRKMDEELFLYSSHNKNKDTQWNIGW